MSLFIRPSSDHSEGSEGSEAPVKPKIHNPFEPQRTTAAIVDIPPSTSTSTSTPASSTTLDQLLENHDTQIRLGLAHDNALKLLNNSVDALAAKLDDVKADKLPSVITAASKVVVGIRKERNEAIRSGINKEVHYHFYTPEQRKVSDYEVIDVG
jgi:hypothetical protein